MDTFLQTELPAIVWASLLAVVVGLYALKGWKRREGSHGAAVGILLGLATLVRVAIAVALIAVGVGSFLVGRELQHFPILEGRHPVGVVQIWWTRGDTATMLNISRSDDPFAQAEELVQIPGSSWGVRAEVISWPTWGATLGLRTIYRIKDVVAWEQGSTAPVVFSHAMPHSRQKTWNHLLTYGPYLPGFPPVEVIASRRTSAAENTIYRLVMTPEALEINEEITRAPPLLRMPAGEET
ncbi:hypothetical protein JXA88_18625 [Candidatus Fermentibacteria bacterium]|nr:hypothetical protein [Candidatus Fermentibacteria bacterium]